MNTGQRAHGHNIKIGHGYEYTVKLIFGIDFRIASVPHGIYILTVDNEKRTVGTRLERLKETFSSHLELHSKK